MQEAVAQLIVIPGKPAFAGATRNPGDPEQPGFPRPRE
jgi:hypothetical protein